MKLPDRGTIDRSIIELLAKSEIGSLTAQEIHVGFAQIRPYKERGLQMVLGKFVIAGYGDLIDGRYHLSQAAHDMLNAKKYQGSVATPREGNVFVETNGAVADHFAGMRRALMGRLA